MGDDQVAGLGFADHRVEQIAEPLDIGVVERRVDFVEDADRGRVGEEQREDQRDRGQRLLAARKQGQRLQSLARRLGIDLKPGFERIVAVDQRKVGLSAFEQLGEQPLEVGVDRLERGAQPLAALAVEVADRTAQAVHCLDQLGLFGQRGAMPRLGLSQLVGRDQVDRAEPLAVGDQLVMLGAFLARGTDLGGNEFEPLGQQRRRALEPFARDTGHLGAAGFLVLGPGSGAGAGLAGRGERFVGLVELRVDAPRGLAQLADLGFGGGQFGGQAGAHFVPGLDLAHQARRLGGNDRALFLDFLEAAGHRGKPAGGIAGAGLPRFDVGALGVAALARDRERLIVRGQPGRSGLQALARGIVTSLGSGELGAAGFGIGQFGAAGFGGLTLGLGLGALLGQIAGAGGQLGAAGLDPGLGRLGLIECAQRAALGIGGGGDRAFGGDHAQLQFRQFGSHGLGLALCRFGRAAQCRQFGLERGEAILGLEPGCFGGTFALGDEAVPAADPPSLGYQPFARGQRAAIVGIGDMDQREPGLELVRALGDMGGEAARNRLGGLGAGPEPAIGVGRRRAERGLGIAPQHRGERALIARRGADCIERDGSGLVGGLPGAGIAIADQRLPFALHPGQFGLGRGQRRRGFVACGLQLGLAGLLSLERGAGRGQRPGGLIPGLLGLGQRGQRIAFSGEAVGQVLLTPGLAIEPRKALLGRSQFGIGDAPFGFDPGLVGSRLGQRQFGLAQVAVGIVERGGNDRAALFVGGELLLAVGQFAFELCQRGGGVLGQAVGIAAVFLQPLVLAVEVLEPFFGGFQLAGQLGHAVAMGAGIVAPVGQFVAGLGQGIGRAVLRVLRRFHRGLGFGHAGFGGLGFCPGGFGGGGGIAPAGEDQPGFGHADPVGQRLVALGGAGLAAQRSDLLIELTHQVFEPGEVGLGRAQLLLGVLAAHVEARDPGRLFEHHPPFGRLGGDHRGDLALADQRGGVRPGCRIGKDQRDVLGPHVAAIDPIGAARAAFDPADDL